MTRPTDEQLLAFLEGNVGEHEREAILAQLEADPELVRDLRLAAAGLEAVSNHGAAVMGAAPGRVRISPWWLVAASVATVALSVPATLLLTRASPVPAGAPPPSSIRTVATGIPEAPDPSFMLILHGRWPDASQITAAEARRRAEEYWAWTSSLAEEGLLVAAGDLRWEPGERLRPTGTRVDVAADELDRPEYMVGMFALRTDSYEEALALASRCPHLRYGGSVSIRRVGSGFVTVPGMGDWAD